MYRRESDGSGRAIFSRRGARPCASLRSRREKWGWSGQRDGRAPEGQRGRLAQKLRLKSCQNAENIRYIGKKLYFAE